MHESGIGPSTMPLTCYVALRAMQSDKPYVAPFIRRLMPDASEEEILEASENLRGYLKILYGLFLEQEAKRRNADSPREAAHDRFQE